MANSPGARGGQGVLSAAKMTMPYQGAVVSGVFSLPSFGNDFSSEKGILDQDLKKDFMDQLKSFEEAINSQT